TDLWRVHMIEESVFRGVSVREDARANRTYPSGRVCAAPGCTTKLSIYNRWQHCWQHEPVHTYVARGKRRSRKRAA
ncbi:MAG: hypothetical protein AB1551_07695, partial [Actinomycetota bacterium]